MKRKLFSLSILLLSCLGAFAQNKASWTNDITINPIAGRYTSKERVVTGFDGTVFAFRAISASAGANTNQWEILMSSDHGQNFDTFIYSGNFFAPSYKLTAFDMVGAGNDSASFKLFCARAYVDTAGSSDTVFMAIDTFNLYYNEGFAFYYEQYHVYDPYHRGITSISLSTDTRDRNNSSSPFSLSIAMAKAGPSDSIIVFTDEGGGMISNRVAVYGTLDEIRNVSASTGSAALSTSAVGRLGIAWDEYQYHFDTFGSIKAAFIRPDNGNKPAGWGPYTIGTDDSSYRRPCISLSLGGGHQGAALDDIRAIISYEHKSPLGDVDVLARVNDSIITNTINFNNGFILADAGGDQLYPHGVYDPVNDKFLFTYYNAVNKALTYMSKSVSSTPSASPNVEMANYRNATSTINTGVWPRVDYSMADNGAVFIWNDNNESMYDASFLTLRAADVMNIKKLVLYPNPASNSLNLGFNSTLAEDANMIIEDMLGRQMLMNNIQVKTGDNNIQLNINELPAGNYILLLKGNKTKMTSRFTVIK